MMVISVEPVGRIEMGMIARKGKSDSGSCFQLNCTED